MVESTQSLTAFVSSNSGKAKFKVAVVSSKRRNDTTGEEEATHDETGEGHTVSFAGVVDGPGLSTMSSLCDVALGGRLPSVEFKRKGLESLLHVPQWLTSIDVAMNDSRIDEIVMGAVRSSEDAGGDVAEHLLKRIASVDLAGSVLSTGIRATGADGSSSGGLPVEEQLVAAADIRTAGAFDLARLLLTSIRSACSAVLPRLMPVQGVLVDADRLMLPLVLQVDGLGIDALSKLLAVALSAVQHYSEETTHPRSALTQCQSFVSDTVDVVLVHLAILRLSKVDPAAVGVMSEDGRYSAGIDESSFRAVKLQRQLESIVGGGYNVSSHVQRTAARALACGLNTIFYSVESTLTVFRGAFRDY